MDQRRFDDLILNLSEAPHPRRRVLLLASGKALSGLLARARFGEQAATAAGCRKVDKPCRRARQCCSGLCRGRKGTKTCRRHGTGTCKRRRQEVVCTAPDIALARCSNDLNCGCTRTTAGTNYCADFFVPSGCTTACTGCAECQRDADCVALGFPPGSACAPTTAGRCTGTCESGTMCLVPCGTAPRTP